MTFRSIGDVAATVVKDIADRRQAQGRTGSRSIDKVSIKPLGRHPATTTIDQSKGHEID